MGDVPAEGDLLTFETPEEFLVAFNFQFQLFPFGRLKCGVVVDVEITVLGVIGIQSGLDRGPVDPVGADDAFAGGLERVDPAGDQGRHEILHALDHDDEAVPVLIHVPDVVLAEIAPVQDEAHSPVPVLDHLVHEKTELGDIIDRARVLLVEQGDLVGLVEGDGKIENRQSLVVLRLAELHEVDVPRLAVLVGRVVGDVQALPVVPFFIPAVKEADGMVLCDGAQQPGDLRIAVDHHAIGKQGMRESEVGIVLRRIVLADDGVAHQVEKQAAVLPEMFLEHAGEPVFLGDLVDYQIGPYPQATAPAGLVSLLGKDCSRKVGLVVFIRVHPGIVLFTDLADDRPLGDVELAGRIIDAFILEQHERGTALLLDGDLALDIRDSDGEIVIHAAS